VLVFCLLSQIWDLPHLVHMFPQVFSHHIRPTLGPSQPPIHLVPVAHFPGVKQPVCEANHWPSPSAKVKNAWSYTSTPTYISMAQCLVKHSTVTFPIPQLWQNSQPCAHDIYQTPHLHCQALGPTSIGCLQLYYRPVIGGKMKVCGCSYSTRGFLLSCLWDR